MLILALWLTFGQIVRHDFVIWDDEQHVVFNPHFNPVTFDSTLSFWREPYFGLYVPVSYTVFAVEAWLARQPPAEDGQPRFSASVFHAGSLTLHIVCALLVFVLLRQLLHADWAALAGALLFALHPLQVESVAWVSETRGLLAAIFSLATLLAWLRFLEQTEQRARWRWYGLATLGLLVALLCKPSAAALPLLAAVLSLIWLRGNWRLTLLCLAPWLVLVALVAYFTQRLQTAEPMLFVPPLWARPLIAADALQFYLEKLCIPSGLAAHYDRSPRAVMESSWFPYCWIVPVLLAVLLLWRPRRTWLASAGLFLAALLPVLGLAPFGYQDYSTVADRYAYLALLGPALLLAAWLAADDGRNWKWPVAGALLAWFAWLSFCQAAVWRDTETLFTHTLAVNPRSEVAHDNYALYLIRQHRPEEALAHCEATLRIDPRSAIAQGNRATALEALGRDDEALRARRLAVEYDPARAAAHIDLGNALIKSDRLAEAEAEYRQALVREPDSILARFNLAVLFQKQGRHAEAIAEFQRVLSHHPEDYRARMNLGLLLARAGKFDAAALHFAHVVETTGDLSARVQLAETHVAAGQMQAALGQYKLALQSPGPSWPQIAGRVAWLLSTHPDSAAREGQQALRLAQEACRQTAQQRPELLRSLAAAYAELGQFESAAETAGRARQLAAAKPDEKLSQSLAADLEQYRAHRAIRETPVFPGQVEPSSP